MDADGAPNDDEEIIDLDMILQADIDAFETNGGEAAAAEGMDIEGRPEGGDESEEEEEAPPPQEPEISSEEDEAYGRRARRRARAPIRFDPSALEVAPRRRRTQPHTSITTRWGGTIQWPPKGYIYGCHKCKDDPEGCKRCKDDVEWQRGINGRMNQLRLETKRLDQAERI